MNILVNRMDEFVEFKEGDTKEVENEDEINNKEEELNIENNNVITKVEEVIEIKSNEIIMINNDKSGHASLPPLIFNPDTHNPLPSISPRVNEYKEDKKSEKAMKKYLEKHPEISLIIQEMNINIIKHKPENILQYLSENFFHDDKLIDLAQKLHISSDEVKQIPFKKK